MEEVAIDVACEQLALVDCQRTVEFEIFSHLRHRYAPGVERNTEFWFRLALPMNARLSLRNIWTIAGLMLRKPPR